MAMHHSLFSELRPERLVDALEFSDRLRSVLSDARDEAGRLKHEHVGTEHLLMALLSDSSLDGDEPPSRARVVLDVLGVDRARMRQVLEQTVLRGRTATPEDLLTYTSRARAVLELAMSEARVSKASTVDTQHLLLGLVREERGIAAQVLLDFGVTIEKARAELARIG
jgi:ATP-dependent Clp protease ATP-binding subunit ClpC